MELNVIQFQDAVLEYKKAQEEVAQSFVQGCIQLGEILCKYRQEMRKSGQRMSYCEAIGIHITNANQMIRLFEYSINKAKKDILGNVITNRAKLNLFLSLDDEKREQVLDSDLASDSSTDDFRDIVLEVKKSREDVAIISEEKPTVVPMIQSVLDGIENPVLQQPKKAAEYLRKELKMDKQTDDRFEVVIHIERAKEVVKKVTAMNVEIPRTQKMEMKKILLKQMQELATLMQQLF